MKALLLVLLLTIPAYGQSKETKAGMFLSKWTFVESEINNEYKSYFAPSTIQRDGEKIKVWMRFDLPSQGEFMRRGRFFPNADVISIRARGQLDCLNKSVRILGAIAYDSDDRIVEIGDFSKSITEKRDNSIAGAVFRYFCEASTPLPVGPPKLKPSPSKQP